MTLDHLLIARIRERGPMTVAAFTELALYDPALGYYARATRRSGRAGDFFTSVDVGPLFGDLLARQVAEMSTYLGPSGAFTLVEAGAGDGRLANDVLAGLSRHAPSLLAHMRLHLAERSEVARAAQAATLAQWPHVPATSSVTIPNSFDGVLVANELLDAMPAHAVVMREEGLRELFVDEQDGVLTTREGAPSSPEIAHQIASTGLSLSPGARAEVSLAAVEWVRGAARALTRGFMVLIDYGYEAATLHAGTRQHGTLSSFHRHQAAGTDAGDSWLQRPGSRDITADVNFTAVRQAAEAEGCVTLGLMDQTYFLLALAADRLVTFDDRQRRAFKTLMMPGGLGSTMKVLVLARGVGTPRLVGCSGPARLT